MPSAISDTNKSVTLAMALRAVPDAVPAQTNTSNPFRRCDALACRSSARACRHGVLPMLVWTTLTSLDLFVGTGSANFPR